MMLCGLWFEQSHYESNDETTFIGAFSSIEKRQEFMDAMKPILEKGCHLGWTALEPFEIDYGGKWICEDIEVDVPLHPSEPVAELVAKIEAHKLGKRDMENERRKVRDAAIQKIASAGLTPEEFNAIVR